MTQWISLYFSGQYPGFYRLPNRFDILLKIRQLDGTNFGDSMISLLKDKSDVEYYNTLLSAFESIHGAAEFERLLQILGVPEEVKRDPTIPTSAGSSNGVVDLKEWATRLEALNETEFSRYVVMPILQKVGYENVEYKGKVNATDLGTDFYVVKFTSPGNVDHWAGVQVKAKKMTDGDTSSPGSELNKLISEVTTAFSQPHRISTGEEVRISEMLVLNSHDVTQGARDKFFNSFELGGKKIRFLARDGVLGLLNELGIDSKIIGEITK